MYVLATFILAILQQYAEGTGGRCTEIVKIGSKGDCVKVVQRAVGTAEDGIFGTNTKNAVIQFQENSGLTADGIVGPKTWDAIYGDSTKNQTAPSSCENPTGECKWYLNYLAKSVNCNGQPEDEYAKSYGYKYCKRFSSFRSKFSDQGKSWVDITMRCLQSSLANYVYSGQRVTSCKAVKKAAFTSHSDCYQQKPSICDIPTDWTILLKVLDLKDIASEEGIKQAVSIIKRCSCKYWDYLVSAIKNAGLAVAKYLGFRRRRDSNDAPCGGGGHSSSGDGGGYTGGYGAGSSSSPGTLVKYQ